MTAMCSAFHPKSNEVISKDDLVLLLIQRDHTQSIASKPDIFLKVLTLYIDETLTQ